MPPFETFTPRASALIEDRVTFCLTAVVYPTWSTCCNVQPQVYDAMTGVAFDFVRHVMLPSQRPACVSVSQKCQLHTT